MVRAFASVASPELTWGKELTLAEELTLAVSPLTNTHPDQFLE